ncbi:MAG: nucleotidyl transferase AbiEii/AbiGii toxin family protein [Candidatus Woesearchaeota archaeon]
MDIDELRRLAAKNELSLNYIAKDEMISKALFEIQGNEDIILKGGTAINRVYLANKRFSEDIDTDLRFGSGVKRAVARTKEIVSKLSFPVSEPRQMKDTIRYDLFYQNPLNHKDKIRLEFKILRKTSGYSKAVTNFGFVPYKSSLLNVYTITELIKMKIDCIMNRLEAKDFFDIYYLLDLPHRHIKISKDEAIQKAGFLQQSTLDILNHYIPKSQRPNWDLFIAELKDKLRKY